MIRPPSSHSSGNQFQAILQSKDHEQCPVCLDYFHRFYVRTICTHVFHKTCINRWMQTNFNCPVCRTKLGSRDVSLYKVDISEDEQYAKKQSALAAGRNLASVRDLNKHRRKEVQRVSAETSARAMANNYRQQMYGSSAVALSEDEQYAIDFLIRTERASHRT